MTVVRARFDPFRFDDARNTALALLGEYDLVLRLDADEELEPGWREAVEAVYDPENARYRYTVVNHGDTWGQIMRDDLHRRHGFRWRLPTHEVLDGPGPICDVPGMVVHHYPEGKDRSFNLSVLAEATITDPHDPRMAFYYARELWYVGYWTECREAMSRFLAMPGWPPERCEGYRILAAIDDFPERWLWRAVAEAPERREPWMDLLRLYRVEGGRAAEAAAVALMAGQRTDPTIYTTDPTCWGPQAEIEIDAASPLTG